MTAAIAIGTMIRNARSLSVQHVTAIVDGGFEVSEGRRPHAGGPTMIVEHTGYIAEADIGIGREWFVQGDKAAGRVAFEMEMGTD